MNRESHLVHSNHRDVWQQFYFDNPNNVVCIGLLCYDRFAEPYDHFQFLPDTCGFDDHKYCSYIHAYYKRCSQQFYQYMDRHYLNKPIKLILPVIIWHKPFLPTQFRRLVFVPVPQTAEHWPHSVHVVHSPSWLIRFGDAVSAKHWALKQNPTPPPCMLHLVPSNGAECLDLQNVGFTLSEHHISWI